MEPWRWRQVEALKGQGIMCMDQAPNGVIWFGGMDGIASYDGINVKRYALEQDLLAMVNKGLVRPRITDILMLDDHRMLVVIGRSLVLRDAEQWRMIIPNIGTEHHSSKLHRAADGSIRLMVRKKLWYISPDLSRTEVIATALGAAFF